MPDETVLKPEPSTKSVKDLWNEAKAVPDDKEKPHVIEAWKQTVSVQMHFNEICMTIRNIAITVLVSAIGLAAYSTKEKAFINVFGWHAPIGALVAIVGLIGWTAFWAMDRHWYHTFLRAAGTHAGGIEERWHKQLPELLLSSQIAEASRRYVFKSWTKSQKGFKFDSGRRLTTFYAVGALVLILTSLAIAIGQIEIVPEKKTDSASAPAPAAAPKNPPPTPANSTAAPQPTAEPKVQEPAPKGQAESNAPGKAPVKGKSKKSRGKV